jgi:tRNA 5-methylaminomethyl-2-thiouridine biosynthesis bifunctional protein
LLTATGISHPAWLAAVGLPQRWASAPCFVVLETHFDQGQRFLAAWAAWRADPLRCAKLVYVAVLPQTMGRDELQRGHAKTGPPELASMLAQAWPPATHNLHSINFEAGHVQLLTAVGDVAHVLPGLRLLADAFLLTQPGAQPDTPGFEARVFKALGRKAQAGARLWAPGHAPALLAGLRGAGFQVQPAENNATSGDGASTQALYAPHFLPSSSAGAMPKSAPSDRSTEAVVIGAGLAGAAVAQALAQRGLQVTVFDRHATPAAEASGNPAGLFHGTVHAADGSYARLFRTAALHAQRWHAAAIARGVPGSAQGLLRMQTAAAEPAEQLLAMQALQRRMGLPPDYVCAVSAMQASALAGVSLSSAAWWYPGGGWLAPPAWVADALAQPGVHFVGGVEVHSLTQEARPDPQGFDPQGSPVWLLHDRAGQLLARTALLVLAHGAGCARLGLGLGLSPWPLSTTRGQVTHWPATKTSAEVSGGATAPSAAGATSLRLPVTGDGYAIPLPNGGLLCGASREPAVPLDLTTDLSTSSAAPSPANNLLNIQRLHRLTGLQPPGDASLWQARVGWRLQTSDSLPIAGAMPLAHFASGQRLDQVRLLPRRPGLFVLTALGSRGLTWAPLLADLVAAQALGEPWPLEQDLADAIDPARWLVRAARAASRPLAQTRAGGG